MISVVAAMTLTENSMTRRRPIRSATVPSRTPPSGRIANPTPKTASAASVAPTGVLDGKNWGPISAASRPKTIQSYHSSVLPRPRPSRARRVTAGGACVGCDAVVPGGVVVGGETETGASTDIGPDLLVRTRVRGIAAARQQGPQ